MDEPFLDLSIDIDQNASLSYCLKKMGQVEVMKDSDKFYCDKCKGLQEAEKKL